jgi:signal transduction histidine kinase
MTKNTNLEVFLQKSAREIVQRGTLTAALGSSAVGIILFFINLHFNAISNFFTVCIMALAVGNVSRFFLFFDRKSVHRDWFKRMKWTNTTIMLGFCGIFYNSYLFKDSVSNILFTYLVINALVSSAVFWQFTVKSEIVVLITCYLMTAAVGFFIWSDDFIIRLYGTILISIYFAFLMKQTSLKRDNWFEQKKNEFELRNVMFELPQNIFENQPIDSIDQRVAVNEISVSELQAKMVSQLKKTFSENEKKTQELARADKMASIGEMLSGIMHEINNPISIITSRIQLISNLFESEKVDINSLRKSFEVISRNAFRTSKIIAGVKALVRETQVEHFVSIELKEIIEKTNEALIDKLKKNLVDLKIQMDHCDENFKLYCFPLQISQVLVNLIGNSCDALKDSNEKWILVRFEFKANNLIISVTDSGLGLNAEIQKRIESPFYSSKKSGEGTGIGLHISKKIIESHKGRFYYNSESKNTQFVIDLPLQSAG